MTPDAGFGVWDHRGDCGVLKPSTGFGRWVHPGDGACDPMFMVLEGGHPGYGRHVTSGTGSGLGVTLETLDILPKVQDLEWSQPRDSGHEIPGTVSGDVCHHIDSGNVTQGAG